MSDFKSNSLLTETKNEQNAFLNRAKKSSDKALTQSIFPNARPVLIDGNFHIFNDGVDLSTLHLMPIPKSLEQAWLHAANSALYAESIAQFNAFLRSQMLPYEESLYGESCESEIVKPAAA